MSSKVEYVPKSVKDIFIEMRNLSSLMIDLSYSAFLYRNRKLAKEVIRLGRRVDYLTYILFMNASLAVRDKEDAEMMSAVMKAASAVDMLSNAASDIAELVLRDIAVHPLIMLAFEKVDESVFRIKVREGDKLAHKTLEECGLETRMGINVLAIRRGNDWYLNPELSFKLIPGDAIIVRGNYETIERLEVELGLPEENKIPEGLLDDPDLRLIIRMIIQLKNTNELMTDLAFSSIMFQDVKLAEEVASLENFINELHTSFELKVLEYGIRKKQDEKLLLGLLRLGITTEELADAAYNIADIILRGLEPHPIIKEIIEETEEAIIRVSVEEGSSLVKKTIDQCHLEDVLGLNILAIRRENTWYFDPPDEFEFEVGDIIIARAYPEMRDKLITLAKGNDIK
ncbi:MAG: potassium channel family protein [Candidatus Asgardarchaeia archaeon]